MRRLRQISGEVAVLSLLFCGLAEAQMRVFFVPLGDDPASYPSGVTTVQDFVGNPVCFDFWLTGEPTEIIAAQTLIEEPFSGGTIGSMFTVEGSESLDQTHPQYLGNLFVSGSVGVAAACCCDSACLCPPVGSCDAPSRYRAGTVIGPTALETIFVPVTSSYVGTMCFQSTTDASGTFTVPWNNPGFETKFVGPDQQVLQNVTYDSVDITLIPCVSNADCEDGDLCTQDLCSMGACTFPVGIYGDVDQNGSMNIFDLFCVLDGLNNVFTTCPLIDVDIAPCSERDGVVSVFDLFAVLDALNGIDACCTP